MNPYTLPHLQAVVETARQRVVSLQDAKKVLDESLKQAKVKLAEAETELLSEKQLRMFG